MSEASVVQHAARRPSIRLLVLGWSLWLLVIWGMLWMRYDVGPAAVRGLVFAAALGMLLVWPALRLSQLGSVAGVALDWVVLNALWQTVVWPLMQIANWSAEQVMWLSVGMGAWSLWVGLFIAVGGQWRRGGVRAGAMALCVLLLLGEAGLMAMGGGEPWAMRVSPLGALWALTEPSGYFQARPWADRLVLIASIGAGGWGVLLTWRLLGRRGMR